MWLNSTGQSRKPLSQHPAQAQLRRNKNRTTPTPPREKKQTLCTDRGFSLNKSNIEGEDVENGTTEARKCSGSEHGLPLSSLVQIYIESSLSIE